MPTLLGFSAGLVYRDNTLLSVNKKISMSLADYYQIIGEKPNLEVSREFPEVNRLLARVENSSINNN
jgi:hypothetical protein